MKTCRICNEEKGSDEYYTKSTRCKSCHKEYNRTHYETNKQYYVDKAKKRDEKVKEENKAKLLVYLRSHNCIDCGSDDLEVLEFDHRDPSMKTYSVGAMLGFNWDTIQNEIDKCDVRCRNCHIRKTRRQFGWWMRD